MVRTSSERAKKGTRDQINEQIKMMKSIVASKQDELKKVQQRYGNKKLPGYKKMTDVMKSGIAKAKKDLAMLETRKRKLAKEGKI